ncbi:transmembrane protease serine 12 [Mixophyes fleayi]|uniref:transmembrane protease serine 12 n=1 Tax=Mixophyes fleayi TaxID=3061075 RepID=UPI003F4DA0ED
MDAALSGALFLWWVEMVLPVRMEVCGQRPLIDTLGSRIIGGHESLPGAWPWQVSLQFFSSGYRYTHLCGGSLIHNIWVITAAHCVVKRRNPRYWRAVFGINSILHAAKTRRISGIRQISVHANFDVTTMDNDVALLELSSSISYTDYIQPVCLATRALPVDPLTQCFITGWGTTTPGGEISVILQEAQIYVIPTSICNSPGWYNGIITGNMLCAGYESGGIDTCQGDSGGPFVCYMPEKDRFYQLGITSFGYNCAKAHYPGVYTLMENYANWIGIRTANATDYFEDRIYDTSGSNKAIAIKLYFINALGTMTWLLNVM